jgi:predicted lipoprotein with Yx(FWY)xxD motif
MLAAAGSVAAALSLSACGATGYGADPGRQQAAAAVQPQAAQPAGGEPAAAAAPKAAGAVGGAQKAARPAAGAQRSAQRSAQNSAKGSWTGALRAERIKKMGSVVTDQQGWVLYRFDKDTANGIASACEGKCAAIWPPAITRDGIPSLRGIPRRLVGTVTRADGTKQLTLNGWPLYRYIGDKVRGQWKGQNVGGTWFVIAPSGKKNLTCVPENPPPPPAPPAAPAAAKAADDGTAEDPGGESTDSGSQGGGQDDAGDGGYSY